MLTLTEILRLDLWAMRPQIVAKLIQLEDRSARELGLRLYVREYGGYRGPGIQDLLIVWRNDNDKRDGIIGGGRDYYAVAPAGQSWHEYGAAFDVGIVDELQRTDANYRKIADLSRALGLRPGYYFPKRDEFHHELNEPLDVARDRWRDMMQRRHVVAAAVLLALTFFFRASHALA